MPSHASLTGSSVHETKLTRLNGSPITLSTVASAAGVFVTDQNNGDLYVANSTTAGDWTKAPRQAAYYDLSGQSVSAPTSSQVLMNVVFGRAVTFDSSFTGSVAKAGTAATAQTDFLIKLNGTTKITMRFAASGTSATFVSGTAFTTASGDLLTVVAPASADATLANITWTFLGAVA